MGSHHCNEELLHKGVELIKSRSDCITFLGADLIEASIYGSVGSVHSQKLQIDEQIEKITKILSKIRNKILFCIDGNHEHRIEKATGLNLTKVIADILKIPFLGWEALFNIRLGKNKVCSCYAHHGTGNSSTSGAKLNSLEKLHFRAPLSNLIICGHMHFPVNSEKEIRYIDAKGKIRKYTQYFVGCGSIHESDGYASMKALSPIQPSLTKIHIQVTDNQFYIQHSLIK